MKIVVPKMSIGSWVKFEFLDENDRPTYAFNALTGERVWGGWWYPNLITDQGLDGLASAYSVSSVVSSLYPRGDKPGIRSYMGLFTGSLNVKRPSGTITLSQSGNTVTASAAFFQAGDVGSEIVWDNATRAKITVFTSATSVTVADSKSVSAAPATLYATGATSVPAEVQNGNSDGGFIGSLNVYTSGNDLVYECTIPTVITLGANQNLTGFRFGPTTTNSAHIIENFRDTSGNPITVSIIAGKKVRVDHMLQLRVASVVQSGSINLLDYDAANNLTGTTALSIQYKTRWPNPSSGLFTNLLNPADNSGGMSFANNAQTLDSTGWTQIATFTTMALSSYSPGSFQRNKTFQISEAQGNGTWYGFSLDPSGGTVGNFAGIRVLTTPSFTKDNTQQMSFKFLLSWGREYI